MKRLLFLTLICTWLGFTTDKTSAVTGVWRAQMEGSPALVMTISDEGGDLTGAILFYLLRHNDGQPPRSSPGIPEPLLNLRFDGKVLDFRVSHRHAHGTQTVSDPPVSFHLKITGPDKGILVREDDETHALPVVRTDS